MSGINPLGPQSGAQSEHRIRKTEDEDQVSASRIAGTPAEGTASQSDRGLILLQIDGLSKGTLERAMEKGYAPNMKKMVDSGKYSFQKYFCGIPAETLPILSSFFYGIPLAANDWYDKSTGQMVDSIKEEPKIQQQAAHMKENGLLYDGTTYLSPVTGGSGDTAIDPSSLYQDKEEKGTFKALAGEVWKDLKLIKHGGYSIAKMTYKFLRDFFRARSDLKANDQYNTWWDQHYPYLISFADNVFPVIATEGVKESIDRGIPVTYVDYTSYDESGHYYGSNTQKAMESLKIVDEKIGEILGKIEKEKRPYDVIVMSDHGQTDSVLFSKLYGKPVQEMVIDWANECNPKTPAKEGDIVIAHAYSMACVYFNFTKGIALASDIEKHYPGMLEKMANHESMGFVVARTADGMVIQGKEGKITVGTGGSTLEGKDPLAPYGDTKILTAQIADYLKLPHTGDVLLFGTFHDGRIIDFNDKYSMVSLHGGLGGEQTDAFLLYGSDVGLEPGKVSKALDLYEQFKRIKKER
jgi:hypothetical protein